MTLQKAIEFNKAIQMDFASQMSADELNAIQLGIEALKRFKRIQEDYPFAHNWTLPGETEE